jgi:hypothetical protein
MQRLNRQAYTQLSRSLNLANNVIEKAQVYFYRAQTLEALNEINQAFRDWELLAALDSQDIPIEWIQTAKTHLGSLITTTPSPRPSRTATETPDYSPTPSYTSTRTGTPTWTPTHTHTTTNTSTPTDTPSATRTFTATLSLTPTRTLTPTQTLTPTPSYTPSPIY